MWHWELYSPECRPGVAFLKATYASLGLDSYEIQWEVEISLSSALERVRKMSYAIKGSLRTSKHTHVAKGLKK